MLRILGEEYGATTGRPRQTDWFHFPLTLKALQINGVTELVINKMDIMQKLGKWGVRMGDDKVKLFRTEGGFKSFLTYEFLHKRDLPLKNIHFSYSPEKI